MKWVLFLFVIDWPGKWKEFAHYEHKEDCQAQLAWFTTNEPDRVQGFCMEVEIDGREYTASFKGRDAT